MKNKTKTSNLWFQKQKFRWKYTNIAIITLTSILKQKVQLFNKNILYIIHTNNQTTIKVAHWYTFKWLFSNWVTLFTIYIDNSTVLWLSAWEILNILFTDWLYSFITELFNKSCISTANLITRLLSTLQRRENNDKE